MKRLGAKASSMLHVNIRALLAAPVPAMAPRAAATLFSEDFSICGFTYGRWRARPMVLRSNSSRSYGKTTRSCLGFTVRKTTINTRSGHELVRWPVGPQGPQGGAEVSHRIRSPQVIIPKSTRMTFSGNLSRFRACGRLTDVTSEGPNGCAYFVAQDDITKRSEEFIEGPSPFDGNLMVKADYFRLYSARRALAASPWFIKEPEIANRSLLVELNHKSLQLLKRNRPNQFSIPFLQILKGAHGGFTRMLGKKRTFDEWLLVKGIDGKKLWLSTEDHSIGPFQPGAANPTSEQKSKPLPVPKKAQRG